MPLAAWVNTHSAARTLTDAAVLASTMTFNKVVTAALDPCWRRAIACEKATRRAFSSAFWNSGSFCHR
jgi:hypothetical protein